MPVHPDDTIEPPAKVIRRMDEAPETPQPDAEAPAQPEAPSAPDADAHDQKAAAHMRCGLLAARRAAYAPHTVRGNNDI